MFGRGDHVLGAPQTGVAPKLDFVAGRREAGRRKGCAKGKLKSTYTAQKMLLEVELASRGLVSLDGSEDLQSIHL